MSISMNDDSQEAGYCLGDYDIEQRHYTLSYMRLSHQKRLVNSTVDISSSRYQGL